MTPNSQATALARPRDARGGSLAADLGLRALGLALLALAGAAIWWLSGRMPVGARHVPAPPDYLAAAIAFIGTSGGGALVSLGAHIHDPVPIAHRWRPGA